MLDLRSALNIIRPDDYHIWINTGLSLKELGDIGLGLWLDWSYGYADFDRQEAIEKWESFKPESISYRSIFTKAQELGWVNVAKRVQSNIINSDGNLLTTDDAWIAADELAKNAASPNYLIDGVLESKTHGLLAGGSQAFKSFCVLKMAHSICTGKDFFGHTVYETGKVLYICGEGMGALGRRIRALNIVDGDIGDKLIVKKTPLAIDNIADMGWLRQQINTLHPVLVVFDTFSSLATSTVENANEEVARTLRMVTECCSDNGTSSIIVHHYGKDADKGSRGASSFKANVDFELSMRRDSLESMTAALTCVKSKDGEFFDEILIKAHVVDIGLIKQNGHHATSLVLKSAANTDMLGSRQSKALDVIKRLIFEDGIEDGKIIGVNKTQISKALIDAFRDTMANPRKVPFETLPELVDKGILGEKDDFYWII